MKPNNFSQWYDDLNGKKFERITKSKTDDELKYIVLRAQLACNAISYAICYN
jgi:hypothetical protein